MKLLQIFNQYRSLFGGEESVVRMTGALVEKNGGQARLLMRTSRGIDNNLPKKISAFFSGFYNFRASYEVDAAIKTFSPDIVHAHNLYPLFSPSALVACRRARVPVVLSFHNYVQACPRWDHLCRGKICERCAHGTEIHCVLNNCRENIFESLAYAGRSYFSRQLRLFKDNADLFIALSEFARLKLIKAGFDSQRIRVLPNMVDLDRKIVDPAQGKYVAFAGRFSPEKGIHTLLQALKAVPSVPVSLAGDGPLLDQMKAIAPANANFVGHLNEEAMKEFYAQARLVVLPSECFEMCPLVISEAMTHGLPVIASRIGGIPELVDDGKTGLLFEPGNSSDLAEKICVLWSDAELCRDMGTAGRKKAFAEYGEDTYFRRIAAIYNDVTGNQVFKEKK